MNHIAKRLGSRLRKLKKDHFTETVTAAGNTRRVSTLGGQNKLSDAVIDRLQGYFGAAIRRTVGTSVESMKKACIAGFKHVTSTDANPDHEDCVEGNASYCFYQKAIAENKTPPSHAIMKVKCILPAEGRNKVMAVYEDLSKDTLLQKCLSGRTQNPNESPPKSLE